MELESDTETFVFCREFNVQFQKTPFLSKEQNAWTFLKTNNFPLEKVT